MTRTSFNALSVLLAALFVPACSQSPSQQSAAPQSPPSAPSSSAQTLPATRNTLLAALLARPGTPKDWRVHIGWMTQAELDDPALSRKWERKPPSADAPDEVLVAYWADVGQMLFGGVSDADAPADAVDAAARRRLLQAALRFPDELPGILPLLDASDPATFDRLKAFLDANPPPATAPAARLSSVTRASATQPASAPAADDDADTDHTWQHEVRQWLMFHSRYFRDELLAQAAALKVRTARNYFTIENEKALAALAKLDWPAARPLAEKQAADADLRIAAISLSLLHEYETQAARPAAAEASRKRLLAIGADAKAPASARAGAIESLVEVKWTGAEAAQEQWVLAALREPGFADLRDENISYRPLPGALRADSERWMRVLMPLIGGGDRALHDLAIASLLEISSPFMGPASPKPPELLRKLLPWLSDANWSAASGRSLFIEELARQDIPECVSGLIAVVKQEQGGPVFAAAKALERYKPPAAVEPLRTALGHEPDEQTRQAISSALLACGAVDDAEAVAAVEAYGRHVVTREEPIHGGGLFGNIDKPAAPTSPESPLGEAISKKGLSDAVAQRLAARIEAIRPTEPAVATKLIELLSDSQSASVDRYLVRRAITATADEADLDVIQYLAARAPAARKRIAADLRTAAAGHGMPAGIAAAVLADEPISRAILANNADRDRAKGLLAMSRLTRTPLPLETVAHLMQSKDAELAAAAEAYLTNEASPAARALVLARHPGEVKVIGESEWPKERVDPLRREVASQEDGVVEVFALLSGGGFGDAGQRIVRIRRDGSATLTLHGYQGRSRHRLLTPAELADLRRFVAEDHIDDLPPLPWTTVTDGVWYEYIHLTPAGGRCIPMNNPSSAAAGSPYDLVARRFERLEQAGQYEVRYADAAKQIPGLHVLLSVPENQMILGIWRKGDDLRLLVGGDRNEGGASWRAVRDGKLAGPADPPPGRSPPQGWDDLPGELVLTSETNRASLRLADGSTVCQALGAGHWKKRLWKFKPSGGKAQLLTEDDAEYGPPLVTPDGKWIIADRGGEEPAGGPVVRIDVATGKRFPVALPPNVYYNVEAYVPPHGKVLLIGTPQSQPTDDPGKPRPRIFLLLDPATGKTEPITGDFTPLEKDWDPARHHPARKADCFWVAFSVTEQSAETEPSTSSTRIGLYDAHRFVFTPMLTLPGTWIGNREIWVDEDRREVLVAVNEDLVVAPITRQ